MKKKNTNLNIRLEADLFESFKKTAAVNGMTPSSVLRILMAEYVKRGEKDENSESR